MSSISERHSLKELGLTRSRLRTSYQRKYGEGNGDREWHQRVQALLSRKEDSYTFDEMEDLVAVFTCTHDTCVIENPGEYSALQLYSAHKAEETYDRYRNAIVELFTESRD